MASAAGCIRAQWKGALTLSGTKRRTPCALASRAARSIAALVPEITACVGSLSLATWQTSPSAASAASRSAASLPLRAGRPSRPAPPARLPASPGRGCAAGVRRRPDERAGGGERRVFAERVPSHDFHPVGQAHAPLLEDAHRGQRHRHQRGLRVFRERQRLQRPLEHDARETAGPEPRRPLRRRPAPRRAPWQAPLPCRRLGFPVREIRTRRPWRLDRLLIQAGAKPQADPPCQGLRHRPGVCPATQ